MIKVYDDPLENEYAKSIDEKVRSLSWTYEFQPTTVLLNKHWVYPTDKTDTWATGLFWKLHKSLGLKEFFNIEKYDSIYLLGHTYGLEQQAHHDQCDFTLIYYPLLEWKLPWGGGTKVWDDNGRENSVDYRGNRLVIFDGELLHQGLPPAKSCHELRIICVFQCKIEEANRKRLDYYNV